MDRNVQSTMECTEWLEQEMLKILRRKVVCKMASPSKTGGPVVKSGPTYGQNRSRNSDGTWRKKRSDAGQKKK